MKQCCRDYLMEQFGDEDVIKDIYEEYVKSIQEKIPEFEAALAAEDLWCARYAAASSAIVMEISMKPFIASPSATTARRTRKGIQNEAVLP